MFKSITLEMSLKPFKYTHDAYIRSVVEKIFDQWEALLRGREEISIMLWTSEGGEILDYTGDLDMPFEWGYWYGHANMPLLSENDPPETSLHEKKQKYIDNPSTFTYKILRNVVRIIKEVGKNRHPRATVRVGATFDIGPEFAISDFKYHRHPESCKGTGCGVYGLVDCTAKLHGDTYPYAAYPNGIPEDTPMGVFFGKQAEIFLSDMGFDYIWLSNGMGFCYEPWNQLGKIYDGTSFHVEKLPETRKKVFLFWQYFRENCSYPIQTRGTNYSVGIDYASDGVPLYDIYQGNFNITPPPNSPWAAINDDMGIEILGHLTRNAELPGEDYMFRYYLHDPWWVNSPWYDRYEGDARDIYIPMALSRVDRAGQVHNASLMHILSVDNSMGQIPDLTAAECIPHILKAEKDTPDAIPPLCLVYPFRAFTTDGGELLPEMYFGDTFLQNALNQGLPLSGVVSADYLAEHDMGIYRQTILLTPAAGLHEAALNQLKSFAEQGGYVIAYGSKSALDAFPVPCQKVDISGDAQPLFDALAEAGYVIRFVDRRGTLIGGSAVGLPPETPRCKSGVNGPEGLFVSGHRISSLPTMTVHRHDNALVYSVYNRDTTVDTHLATPLGAPILNGFDAWLEESCAVYAFDRCEHRECRVFVRQVSGKVSARECPPVNGYVRRKIMISGLEDAEVCLFPEAYCAEDGAFVATLKALDDTPIPQEGWQYVNHPVHGKYLCKSHVSGTVFLCMPRIDKMTIK